MTHPKLHTSWSIMLQVNLCQKPLFLHQLTHNMTTDCSVNYQFSTWKLPVQYMKITSSEDVVYINCSGCQNKNKKQFVYTTCSELGIFMSWTSDSINNLLSYCGLVDEKIRASDKDLPVSKMSQIICMLIFCQLIAKM